MHNSGYNKRSRGYSTHPKEIRTHRGSRQHEKKLDSGVFIKKTTDVTSRGINIDNLTHVINYDALTNHDDYVRRIGRTSQAGRKGVALIFVE